MSSLIGVMGFTEKLRPKNIAFSLWEFFKKFIISTLFKFMGFSGSPETETRHQEIPTRIPAELILIQELLPVIEISEESATAHAGICAVCLCEYLGGEEIRCLRTCEHVFHRRCLDRWMNRGRWTCPLCRTPIMPPHLLPELDRRLRDTSNFVEQGSEDHEVGGTPVVKKSR